MAKLIDRKFYIILGTQLIVMMQIIVNLNPVWATELSAMPNFEQDTETPNDELRKVFSQAIEGVGGAAIQNIRSISALANCRGPNGEYTTRIESIRSGKTRFDQRFVNREEPTHVVINGQVAWSTNRAGENSLVPPFQKLVTELHEYHRMVLDFQQMFSDFELVGNERFNERDCVKVAAKHQLDGDIFLFFDTATKRLVGYSLPVGEGQSVVNVFNEWKEIEGVYFPTRIVATDSAGDWHLNFDEIRLNQSDEADFEIPPRVKDHVELLNLQKEAQAAHLTYDAERFIALFADQVTQIRNGQVDSSNKADNLKRIKTYFDQFEFEAWEDIKPPVITISNDGSMATILVQKRVRGSSKSDEGDKTVRETEFAWLEVWQKQDGQWKVVTVASTRKS